MVRSKPGDARAEAPCRLLEWDSEHFGFPIAEVTGGKLDQEVTPQIETWCREQGVRCLYLLADADDAPTALLAADHDFRVVDHRVIARRDLRGVKPAPDPEGFRVREATEADLPRIRKIAARSHGATRFYFDGRFPRERSDAMYEVWVRNGLTDERLQLNVAEADGELLGYHVIRRPGPDRAGNGVLLAVDDRHRGRGVDLGLMNVAAGWSISLGAESVTATMQGRSAGVIRMHERLGYLTESVHVWHHRWFD